MSQIHYIRQLLDEAEAKINELETARSNGGDCPEIAEAARGLLDAVDDAIAVIEAAKQAAELKLNDLTPEIPA